MRFASSGEIITCASATARRAVTAFSPTSTMAARPWASTWVRILFAGTRTLTARDCVDTYFVTPDCFAAGDFADTRFSALDFFTARDFADTRFAALDFFATRDLFETPAVDIFFFAILEIS